VWLHPVVVESLVDNRNFDFLDGHCRLVDTKDARRLTWCWTKATGEFREVVGRVQSFDCLLPLVAPSKVVPLWNQIAEWATLMTERNSTVHASARLLLKHGRITLFVNFVPISNSNRNWSTLRGLTLGYL
jgi:hypothetical protein